MSARRYPTWSRADCGECGRRIRANNEHAYHALNAAALAEQPTFCAACQRRRSAKAPSWLRRLAGVG